MGKVLAADETISNEISVERSVILVVNEKEPRIAYSNALIPVFGPLISVNYVSYSPMEWETNRELKKRAQRQMLWNLGMIVGGALIDRAISGEKVEEAPFSGYTTTTTESSLCTFLGFVGAVIHNHFLGRRWRS